MAAVAAEVAAEAAVAVVGGVDRHAANMNRPRTEQRLGRYLRACLGALCGSLFAAATALAGDTEAPVPEVESAGIIGYAPLNEISGCVASRTWPDVIWLHNDSGDAPRLFAIEPDGTLIIPDFLRKSYGTGSLAFWKARWPGLELLGAINHDWEDIAIVGDALVIADMGNNGNHRRDLGVIELAEPNPRATVRTRARGFRALRYPEQQTFPGRVWEFDSEALFHDPRTNRLYAITKHRRAGQIRGLIAGAHLYGLPEPASDGAMTRIATRADIGYVTAADLSADGEWLAVAGYRDVWFLPRPDQGENWFAAPGHRIALQPLRTRQIEAACWIAPRRLLIINEAGEMFRIDAGTLLRDS